MAQQFPIADENDTVQEYSKKLNEKLGDKILQMDKVDSAHGIKLDMIGVEMCRNNDTHEIMVDMLCAILDKLEIGSKSYMSKVSEINSNYDSIMKKK